MNLKYDKLVEKISKNSQLERDEIETRIKLKQEKISGLISPEGAAQIVAAELGISLDDEKLKIEELSPGMKRVNLIGKVINIFPVRTFTRNDQESKVVNLIIADETSNTKVVLWDTNHIELIEKNKIVSGSVVEIGNAGVRENEVHLGSFSDFKLSNEILNDVITERVFSEKSISKLKISDNANLRAFIVQIFEPNFFNVCNECKKKVNPEGDGFVCVEHGKVSSERRAVLNLVLDDGTETIRGVLFHEAISNLGLKDLENRDLLESQKQDFLGKEMIFSGNVRLNKFFNNLEIIIESIEEVDVDKLLEILEKPQ